MIVTHDPDHGLPALTWPPGGAGDCPHVLTVAPVRFYCTGEDEHDGDHAAETDAGTVATWATGDDGDAVDHEAAEAIIGLAAAVDAAFNPPPRTRGLRRRKGRRK